jgi:adrenodoxin-NADP+ reductase
VRYGVAPDHPEVRKCEDIFERVAEAQGVQFRGGVGVSWDAETSKVEGGKGVKGNDGDIPLERLTRHYDAVLLATGAARDEPLGVPGEDGAGVFAARQFVGWYTGLPSCVGLQPTIVDNGEVVIVGLGNVAMDCARMLLKSVDELRHTDTPEYVLETFARKRVKGVVCVGRRGALQVCLRLLAYFSIRPLTTFVGKVHN